MATGRHAPNRRLAWARLQRGWSYEELAERIRAEMRRTAESDTGLTANTVRRWETGERWPDPRYRKHLVSVFAATATDLGLLRPDELALRPVADVACEVRRLVAMALEEYGDGGIDRAAFLRGLLGVGALNVITTLAPADGEPTQQLTTAANHVTGVPAVLAYARIVGGQRELYWTSQPNDLFELAYTSAQLGTRLIRGAGTAQIRTPLGAALAECAMLAGRLALFDLRESAVAQRCFDTALAATREAGDHALAAAVLGHMAFVPGFAGDTSHALELVSAAHQHCWYGVSPVVRSWLHCVASEMISHSPEPTRYRHRIELAEEALDGSHEPVPEWCDFYDSSRLRGFAGYSALAAGDTDTARDHLRAALDALAPTGKKQRTVLLADLASAHLDDADHAASLLRQALDLLEHDWYATGHQRVGEVIRRLPHAGGTAELNDRYRARSPAVW